MLRINPAFQRFPQHAAIIGRILVAFGELEFAFCRNAGLALDNHVTILRLLYNLRQTSSQLESADILVRPVFEAHGLLAEHETAYTMVRSCLTIRNQYAHCNWADDALQPDSGLFFADLQDSAQRRGFEHSWKHVDVPLLTAQEQYFSDTLEMLDFLKHEIALRRGKLISHAWPRRSEPTRPPPHNPESQHVPPWLSEDKSLRHKERAAEQQRAGQQPERPPSVLRLHSRRMGGEGCEGCPSRIRSRRMTFRSSSIALSPSANSGDCGQGFRLIADSHSDRSRTAFR